MCCYHRGLDRSTWRRPHPHAVRPQFLPSGGIRPSLRAKL
jgi:hypothetical protein